MVGLKHEFTNRLKDKQDAIDKAVGMELLLMGHEIADKAVKVVPWMRGILASSIKAKKTGKGASQNVEVTAGSVAIDYARVQHEDPTLRHLPGRHWKYLTIPWVEVTGGTNGKKARDRINEAVRQAVK